MIVTRQLLDATDRLSKYGAFRGIDPSRVGLVADVQSRARELSSMREETALEPFQIEYLQCLRSRLQDFCLVTFTAATDWLDAFSDAYNR